MQPVPITSRILRSVRLLLDIYGIALFMILAGSPLLGFSPYEGVLRLGAPGFYVLVASATLIWLLVIPAHWRRSGQGEKAEQDDDRYR